MTRSDSREGRARRTATLAGFAVWLVLPLGLIAFSLHGSSAATFAPPIPAWVSVESDSSAVTRSVDVALAWDSPAPLRAPDWSGLVQSVEAKVGSALESGDLVATIDAVDRVAWQTPTAFHRPLSIGDKGLDVDALKDILRTRGSDVSTGKTFDESTLAGVRTLARSLGVVDGDEAPGFDPGWIVFLPHESYVLEDTVLAAGTLAPSYGESIATGSSALTGSGLVDRGAASQPASSAIEATPRSLDEMTVLLASAGVRASDDETLVIAGQDYALTAQGESLEPAELERVRSFVPVGGSHMTGILTRTRADGWLVVPSASLTPARDTDGFLVCRLRDGKPSATPVVVLTSSPSGTYIEGDLTRTDQVRLPAPSASEPCR